MSRRGILTGGTWCLDRNIMVNTWPAENGRADILEDTRCGGGSSYNLAANIRTLDPTIPVATMGLVGNDADGAFLIDLAASLGIENAGLNVAEAVRTDYTLAFASRESGKRQHISSFSAAHALTPDHFDVSRSTARLLHLGLPGIHDVMDNPWEGEANGWVAVLKKARQAGLATNMELISIEPERLATLIRPCLPHLDLLVVNDHEIGGLSGVETVKSGETDWAPCIEAAGIALDRGVHERVVVHFPEGAVSVGHDGSVATKPSVKVPSAAIQGANGAGDAFASGFVYAWHEEWPLEDALALAHAVAAASLRDISTTGAIEPWEACLRLADGWGWRETPPARQSARAGA